MAIRVIARIRPQQAHELDPILTAASHDGDNDNNSTTPTLVRIPSHKNDHEIYTFQFSGVYGQHATQQAIFDNEGQSVRRNRSPPPKLLTGNLMRLQWRPRSSISSTDSTSPFSPTAPRERGKRIRCEVGKHWPSVGSSHDCSLGSIDGAERSTKILRAGRGSRLPSPIMRSTTTRFSICLKPPTNGQWRACI